MVGKGGYTGLLQPMDLAINYKYKSCIRKQFNNWCTEQFISKLQNKEPLSNVVIEDSLPVLKERLITWITAAHNNIQSTDVIAGFEQAGTAL
jgi:hypothetical protein